MTRLLAVEIGIWASARFARCEMSRASSFRVLNDRGGNLRSSTMSKAALESLS